MVTKSQMLEKIHKTTGNIPTNFAGLKKTDLEKILKKPENAPFGSKPINKKMTPSQRIMYEQMFSSPYKR